MPRVKAQPAPVVAKAEVEPEESDETLAEVDITNDDIAEQESFEAQASSEIEDDDPYGFNDEPDEEEAAPVAKPVPEGRIQFVYKGLRAAANLQPKAITVIVPSDGTPADDVEASITDGSDFTLRLDEPVFGTPEQVEWLTGHPYYRIEKV